MLLGTFAPKLDDKGRLILPAKFWDDFAAGIVMTKGQERCVYVFSQKEFESVYERARQASMTGKRARDFFRQLLSGAAQEAPDTQRRVTIPPMLRDWAGLDRELTVVGVGTHAEIWDTAAWTAYSDDTAAAFSDVDEEVIPGIF
jgi:MraZ protein